MNIIAHSVGLNGKELLINLVVYIIDEIKQM